MNEEDRLAAALKGDKIAASDAKFWYLLQAMKDRAKAEYNPAIDNLRKELKRRLKVDKER